MTALWIIGGVAALLALILCLPVGAMCAFGGDKPLSLVLRLGPMRLTLLPKKEGKKKKAAKVKKTEPVDAPPEKEKTFDLRSISWADGKAILRAVWQAVSRALCKCGKRIRIHPLDLCVTVGGDDPADTAERYGQMQMAVWSVMPRLEELVHIPDPRIHMDVDFRADKTEFSGSVGAYFRVGDCLAIAWAALWPLLKTGLPLWRKYRAAAKAAKKAAAAAATTAATAANDTVAGPPAA